MIEEMKGGCIRVQSSTNEWMDCMFLVSQEDKERAIEVLKKTWDAFWEEGKGWCYGNFLGARLIEENIAFSVYYADVED